MAVTGRRWSTRPSRILACLSYRCSICATSSCGETHDRAMMAICDLRFAICDLRFRTLGWPASQAPSPRAMGTERGCVEDQPQRVGSSKGSGACRVLRLVEDDTAALRSPPVPRAMDVCERKDRPG